MGKTYFAANWKKELKSQGYKVSLINVFEHDFTDDPLIISSEILKVYSNARSLEQKQIKVSNFMNTFKYKYIFSNVFVNILSTVTSGVINEEIINSIKKELKQPFYSVDIEEYNNSLSSFNTQLNEYVKEAEKPFIIMVDELIGQTFLCYRMFRKAKIYI